MTFTDVVDLVSKLITLGTFIMMLWALKTFLQKPHNSLEERMTKVEVKVDGIDESLKQGNDKFREQAEFNEVFIRCMLGFVTFETNYCLNTGYKQNEDLLKLKELLEMYLAKR